MKTAPGSCPACGHVFTHVDTLEGGDTPMPNPGDLTVCIECAAVLTWDEDMIYQVYEGPAPPEIVHTQAMIRRLKR